MAPATTVDLRNAEVPKPTDQTDRALAAFRLCALSDLDNVPITYWR